MYLQIGDKKINANTVPKVTVPLARETVRDYARLWAKDMSFDMANAPQRKDMLELIQMQLVMQLQTAQSADAAYFDSPKNQAKQRKSGKSESLSADEIQKKKAAMIASLTAASTYMGELLASDELRDLAPIGDRITNGMRSFLMDPEKKAGVMAQARKELDEQWEKEMKEIQAQGEQEAATQTPSPVHEVTPTHVVEHEEHAKGPAHEHEGRHDTHGRGAHEQHEQSEPRGPVHALGIHTVAHEESHGGGGHGAHGHGRRWNIPQTPAQWAAFAALVPIGAGWVILKGAWAVLKSSPDILKSIGWIITGDNKHPWHTMRTKLSALFKLKKGGGGGHGGGHAPARHGGGGHGHH